MSIDRILQLKLVTDVGNINRELQGVEGSVSRVGSAFSTLSGFAGPIVMDAALTGLSALGDAIGGGAEAMRQYDQAVFGLGQSLGDLGAAEDAAAQLAGLATAMGFDNDVALIEGLNEATIRLGDLESAQLATNTAMDVSRQLGIDYSEALDKVIKASEGSTRAMRELGVEGDTADERWASMETTFGGAAEAFTQTADGMRAVADAEIGDVFENMGSVVNDLSDTALPILLDVWQQLKPVIDDVMTNVGPVVQEVFQGMGDIIERVVTILDKLQPAFQKMWSLVEPIVTTIGESIGSTIGGILGILDALVLVLEGGDIKQAFRMAFDGIVNIVKSPINIMLAAVESGLNFLGDIFMQALEAIRSNLNGIAFIGDHIPDERIVWGGISVPRLARGGIVKGPTLAVIGEAGPEAVVPLGRGGGMGPTINVYASVASPADVGRSVVEAIEAYERRAGASWRA